MGNWFEVCYVQCSWRLQCSIEWSALVFTLEDRIALQVMVQHPQWRRTIDLISNIGTSSQIAANTTPIAFPLIPLSPRIIRYCSYIAALQDVDIIPFFSSYRLQVLKAAEKNGKEYLIQLFSPTLL